MMLFKKGVCVLLASVGATAVYAHEIEFELFSGSNTNPNKLPESFEVDAATFGFAGLKISHMPVRTGFYYNLDAKSTVFLADEEAISDPQHADESRGEVELGFKWRPRFKHGRARFKWELYAGARDSTYVFRSTGEPAMRDLDNDGIDEDLGDRFDSTWSGFKTTMAIPISEEADFLFELDITDKQYELFEFPNLSNLNYQQAYMDLGFEKWIWPRTALKTMIGGGFRYYEDRRAKDVATGDDIAGTDLEYAYLEVENTLEYLITNRWKWQMGFEVQQRQDNEDGYYDSTTGKAFMRLRYRNKDAVKFLLSMSYGKRRYDNIDEDPTLLEEEMREREGYSVKAELSRTIFERTHLNMDLVIGVEANDYEASDPNFTYSQEQGYVGIRWRPF